MKFSATSWCLNQPLTTLKQDRGIEELSGARHYHSRLSTPLATSSDSNMCLHKETRSGVKEIQQRWREDGEYPIQSWTTPAFSDESSQQTWNLTEGFQCFPLMNPTTTASTRDLLHIQCKLVRTWPGKQKVKDSVKDCDFSEWKKKDLLYNENHYGYVQPNSLGQAQAKRWKSFAFVGSWKSHDLSMFKSGGAKPSKLCDKTSGVWYLVAFIREQFYDTVPNSTWAKEDHMLFLCNTDSLVGCPKALWNSFGFSPRLYTPDHSIGGCSGQNWNVAGLHTTKIDRWWREALQDRHLRCSTPVQTDRV